MPALLKQYKSIKDIGTNSEYSFYLNRRIRLVNIIAFWAGILWLAFGTVLFIFNYYIAFSVNLFGALLSLSSIYLNVYEKHIASFYILSIGILSSITFLAISYGNDSGTQYVLIPWFVSVFFLFDSNKASYSLLAIGALSFFSIEYVFQQYAHLNTSGIPIVRWVMLAMCLSSVLFIIDFFKKDSKVYEIALYRSKHKSEMQRREIASQKEELSERNAILEEQTEEIRCQKEMLEEQNAEIEQQNYKLSNVLNELTASVNYARRIQNAIHIPELFLHKNFNKLFLFQKPKDIVSGDFYWSFGKEYCTIIGVADCTGHGVPGAFMTAIGNTLLNQIAADDNVSSPSKILGLLQERLHHTLHHQFSSERISDGMDMALCTIDKKRSTLHYAGANRPLYVYRNGELKEIKPTKVSIGGQHADNVIFTEREINVETGDRFYMFSDGYADQFGGPNGKKMKVRAFKEYLQTIQTEPIEKHKKLLQNYIEDWQGEEDQTDDILIIGFEL